jgi:hypothetical protein
MPRVQEPLAREPRSMRGGSLLEHKAEHSRPSEAGLFDVTIAVELQQMHAKDLNTTVERLTRVIGSKGAEDLKPAEDRLDLQPSLCFPEREAA